MVDAHPSVGGLLINILWKLEIDITHESQHMPQRAHAYPAHAYPAILAPSWLLKE